MIYRCAVKSITVLTGVRLGEHRAQWCSCLYLGLHEMLKRRLLMERVDDSCTSSRQMQASSDSVQPTLASLPHLWDADERCRPARGGDATNPRGFPQPPCKVPDLQQLGMTSGQKDGRAARSVRSVRCTSANAKPLRSLAQHYDQQARGPCVAPVNEVRVAKTHG